MACVRVLVFSSALVAVAATGLSAADYELSSSIMRRQKSTQDIHLHMGSHGDMAMHKDANRDAIHAGIEEAERIRDLGTEEVLDLKAIQPGEVSYCDTDYQLSQSTGTAENSCSENYQPVRRDEDCSHAAHILNKSIGDFQNSSHFLINEDGTNSGNSNPSVYVKNCFLFNDAVFFNPTDSQQNVNFTGWQGVPICHKQVYKAGNATTADAQVESEDACTGDYEWIATHEECLWAHDCEWGGMFCEATTFENDAFTSKSAPKGCYRNEIGCYGYNSGVPPTPTDKNITVGMKAVCRLKTYNFDKNKHNATQRGIDANSAHGASQTADEIAAAAATATTAAPAAL